MDHDQKDYAIRCEWGEAGIARLAPISEVIVIVDVMSFSTAIDIATARGAAVYPYAYRDTSAAAFAKSHDAILAGDRSSGGYSLSPASLQNISAGTKLVLPSPNGSALSLATRDKPTLTGCLRNCRAVAQYAGGMGKSIAVIAAGERWADGTLRPAIEDLIGAGAIIESLSGTRSPEAEVAVAAWKCAAGGLLDCLRACSSGRELVERGFEEDVLLAGQSDVSASAPLLRDRGYINAAVNPPKPASAS
ncbi:MAG TPA: 2-phosphosulfolactate phosphatase [Tepidisphaeraceae bacterium]|jgi:2-phosphosulfolactate phosphatase|nr:2-phosphosulfolactate phosphatase [Tepidisphaeraceae bacterium]HEV8606821.1 2-phosphosulfolactate phosphatase [Tepidisphaeraceae bacterium]